MAQVGRGTVRSTPNSQFSADQVVATFYDRIRSPVLTDITVDWGGLRGEARRPGSIPDVFINAPWSSPVAMPRPRRDGWSSTETRSAAAVEWVLEVISASRVTARPSRRSGPGGWVEALAPGRSVQVRG